MPRALGGAPILSVHWRSLGRSLLANAMRVRRGSPLYNNKRIYGRGVRPRFKLSLHLKNKFFRKEARPQRLIQAKDCF